MDTTYISAWSPSEKTPGNILNQEQAKERFSDGKRFVGIMFSLDGKPKGWIRYGKAKNKPLECLMIYFKENLDRLSVLEFEAQSNDVNELQFYAASFHNEDHTHYRLVKRDEGWSMGTYHGGQILSRDSYYYKPPLTSITFEPFSVRDLACFKIGAQVGMSDFKQLPTV